MGDIQQRNFEFPTAPLAVHNQLTQVEDEIKRLDSLKRKLRTYLKQTIEVEDIDDRHKMGIHDGVRRTVHMRENVSYAKAMKEIVDTLVPKTKLEAVDEIVEKYTRQQWIDKFSLAEDEEDFNGEW
jgi:hypothetical protein